jgi:Uma2 family endonuclease
MTSSLATALATIADLERTPGRCELIDGVIIHMCPAGADHGSIGVEIAAALIAHVKAKKLGRVFGADTGFILGRDPDTVRAPDCAFVTAARLPAGRHPGFLELAPDLVVEVVSPSDRYSDVKLKARMWLDHGSRMVWIVDPEDRQVEIITATSAAELTVRDRLEGGEVLPGFALPLSELFA